MARNLSFKNWSLANVTIVVEDSPVHTQRKKTYATKRSTVELEPAMRFDMNGIVGWMLLQGIGTPRSCRVDKQIQVLFVLQLAASCYPMGFMPPDSSRGCSPNLAATHY